jgi:RNA polymerase sigma factor (sigma-70 family)
MPQDVRQILILRIYKGLSYNEIAGQLNMNENTVKTKMHRVKERIERKLKSFSDGKNVL